MLSDFKTVGRKIPKTKKEILTFRTNDDTIYIGLMFVFTEGRVRFVKRYFPKLLGNDKTKERIGAAIECGTLPHAFLIGGESGSGKTTLATEIAAALNCEKKKESSTPLPCGECNCCKRIYSGNFPDLKVLSKPKDRATLGVDSIKDFREDMFLSSTESDYKIYVIDDAECMTTEAQNALLKVLEEPPKSVIIMILARECDKILTTIKSRAQYIPMARFNERELEKYLLSMSSEARELKATDPEGFGAVLMSADGRLGQAFRLSDKKYAAECAEERSDTIRITKCITGKRSYKEINEALSYLPTKRQELLLSLERLISALRDLVVIKSSATASLLFFTSAEEAKSVLGQASLKRLMSAYDEVCKTHELCSKNANITNLVASLAASIRFI